MNNEQRTLVEKELNKVIRRCLWKPSGDPDRPLLRRAAAVYLALKEMRMMVTAESDVVMVLSGNNCEEKNFINGAP